MKKSLKYIFKILPFKRELFSLVKLIWVPKERIFQHLYFKGIFKVKVDKQHSFKIMHYGYLIENEIFWLGLNDGFEKESIKLWIKLCRKSDVILDIGANTGIYSLIAKSVNPSAVVHAFEPVQRVFSKLKDNISLNRYEINAVDFAVSDSDGEAIIYDTDTEHTYSVTVNHNLRNPDSKVIETKIKTITLDSFIKEKGLKKIDLIKIDVETHEPEVLKGFGEYFTKFKPVLLIEILNDDIGNRVYEIVKDLNYLYFNIDEKGGIRQVEKIVKSDYFNYLFCDEKTAEELGLLQK
jgi:FkbM family methyltransferase